LQSTDHIFAWCSNSHPSLSWVQLKPFLGGALPLAFRLSGELAHELEPLATQVAVAYLTEMEEVGSELDRCLP
jgi:hypothetical protein